MSLQILGSGQNAFTISTQNNNFNISYNDQTLLTLINENSISQFTDLAKEYLTLKDQEKNNYFSLEGTIRYIDLEGGFYGLITKSGAKYIPINIQDQLKDNQNITINECYGKKDAISIYMWGKLIYVVNYST